VDTVDLSEMLDSDPLDSPVDTVHTVDSVVPHPLPFLALRDPHTEELPRMEVILASTSADQVVPSEDTLAALLDSPHPPSLDSVVQLAVPNLLHPPVLRHTPPNLPHHTAPTLALAIQEVQGMANPPTAAKEFRATTKPA